jgi:hypothetical protein
MGYDFQPGESIPLSYNSYQAVFPTPPRFPAIRPAPTVECGSLFCPWFDSYRGPPIRTLVAYSSIGPNVPRRNGAPHTRIMMQRFLLQCQSIESSKAVKPILRAQRLSGILSNRIARLPYKPRWKFAEFWRQCRWRLKWDTVAKSVFRAL